MAEVEHLDVLVVGAGLSGICAGYQLQTSCPGKTYAILEGRASMGGTWDLFRYPGIRSDSDMYTLGFPFRPWTGEKSIADGPSILAYLKDTAAEYGIDRKIRYGHWVERASFSTKDARWTVDVRVDGELRTFTCSFLFTCAGYYDYAEGYTPDLAGRDAYEGRIVHPQHWPEDLDYTGKNVVVIGSGATAVTLVPELAKKAKKVVMLQRSPTYILSAPGKDPIAGWLGRRLSEERAYTVTRWKNVILAMGFYNFCRRYPNAAKKLLVRQVARQTRGAVDVERHFTPSYAPWDQRLCLVPDGDLFRSLRDGKAEVVTDHIDTFTKSGLRLKSGRELEADVVVTATGLKLKFLGGIQVTVDGRKVEASETVAYKGMMASDVPNLALAIGYTNASWTLKCDLTARYVCRLLNHMDRTGARYCVPRRRDPNLREEPLLDFSSGYVQRAIHTFPKQGNVAPWRVYQNYALDLVALEHGKLDDGSMQFVGA